MPERVPPDPQVLAEQLAPVALELARRIRTDPPMRLWRELVAPLDGYGHAGLIMLLAAAVDPSLHPDVLWGWVRHREAIAHPSPIVWPDDQVPIEDMDTEAINELIMQLSEKRRSLQEIGRRVGLDPTTVEARRRRLRQRARECAGAAAGPPG